MMLFHSGEDGNQRPAYRLPGDEIEFNRRNVFRPDQARDFAAGICRSDDRRSAVVDPGLNSPLTKSSHLEKDTSYGMTNEDWHTACGTFDRANRLRQRAVKGG